MSEQDQPSSLLYPNWTGAEFNRLPVITELQITCSQFVVLASIAGQLHESGWRCFAIVPIVEGRAVGVFSAGCDALNLSMASLIQMDVLPGSGYVRIWSDAGKVWLISTGSTIRVYDEANAKRDHALCQPSR